MWFPLIQNRNLFYPLSPVPTSSLTICRQAVFPSLCKLCKLCICWEVPNIQVFSWSKWLGGKGAEGQADMGGGGVYLWCWLFHMQPQEGSGYLLVSQGFKICPVFIQEQWGHLRQTILLYLGCSSVSMCSSLIYFGKNSSLLRPTQMGLRAGVDQFQCVSPRSVDKNRNISSSSTESSRSHKHNVRAAINFSLVAAFMKKFHLWSLCLLAQHRDSPSRKSPLVRWCFACL